MSKNGIVITVGTADGRESSSLTSTTIKDGRIGRKHRGKVVSFKPYGFFVETDDGHFGLVHGKNISGWKWGMRFDRVFKFGSEVEVTVIDVEADTDRMSFSCEMPANGAEVAPEDAVEIVPEESAPVPKTRQEVAEQWIAENPDDSQVAADWLRTELEDGPIYGPLTNVLCERFGVPVPVSYWIRRFPEFVCYSGQGDNPCDLPAVALGAKAGDVAYWNRLKRTASELLEARNRKEDPAAKLGALAVRLDRMSFPGAAWIADFQKMSEGIQRGKDVYGVSDVTERLVIPLLGQLGWDVSPSNAALVRGDATTFDVKLFGGTAQSGDVALAVKCAPAGVSFGAASGNAVEQVLGLYNRLGGNGPSAARIAWTNGREWVLFTRELLAQCIGILAEHRGDKVLQEAGDFGPCAALRRVELPVGATPFAWLAAFADLRELIGC